jgi:hypothetical protein
VAEKIAAFLLPNAGHRPAVLKIVRGEVGQLGASAAQLPEQSLQPRLTAGNLSSRRW